MNNVQHNSPVTSHAEDAAIAAGFGWQCLGLLEERRLLLLGLVWLGFSGRRGRRCSAKAFVQSDRQLFIDNPNAQVADAGVLIGDLSRIDLL